MGKLGRETGTTRGRWGTPGLMTPRPTQTGETELKEPPALVTAVPEGSPLSATRVGCGKGAGPARQPAWKGGSQLTLRGWARGRRTRSPLGVGGVQRSPERGGARAQARGWPPSTGGLQGPRGRGGLCLRSSALGRRQPGYKMAGKGWDRGLSPRGAAPLSLLCRGGGAGVLAPPRPRPPLPPSR